MKHTGIIFLRLLFFVTLLRVFALPVVEDGYSLVQLLLSFGVGLVYDVSMLAWITLLLLFIRSVRVRQIVLVLSIAIWVVLSSFDLISIKYTGTRASLITIELIGFRDAFGSALTVPVFYLSVVISIVAIYFLTKYSGFFRYSALPNGKQRMLIAGICVLCTFVYLPFPISYYTSQLKVSPAMKQWSLNPYYSFYYSATVDRERAPMSFESALVKLESGKGNGAFIWPRPEIIASDTTYDNIIVVIMESFGSNRCGVLGGKKKLSPVFDSLSSDGLLFSRCFATGPRTQYAISSILFGFPHILGYNLFRHNKQRLPFEGICSILESVGYRCHFLHGGRAYYDDMSLIINSADTVQVRDHSDMAEFKFHNSWGIDDESFYKYSANYIGKKFGKNFYCLLSMSNHEPFQVPEDFAKRLEDGALSKKEKSYLYADYALGQFVKGLRRVGCYDRSLIIITGDHGEHYGEGDKDTKLFHVPLLVLNGPPAGRNFDVHSHADIGRYVLRHAGYSGKCHLLGGDLSSSSSVAYFRNYEGEVGRATDSCVYRLRLSDGGLTRVAVDSEYYPRAAVKERDTTQKSRIEAYYSVVKYIFEMGLYHR